MNKSVIRKAVKAATARAAEEFAQAVFELNIKAFTFGLRIEVVEGPGRSRPGTWKGTLGKQVKKAKPAGFVKYDNRGYAVTHSRLEALAKARKVMAAKRAAAKKG